MLEFSSRLSRLFTYSKDSAQENFTTEALAIAIEDDPCPIIDALCQLSPDDAARVGLVRCTEEFSRLKLRPSTQVSLPVCCRLDLVLDLLSEHGAQLGAVWVEVKIDAPVAA